MALRLKSEMLALSLLFIVSLNSVHSQLGIAHPHIVLIVADDLGWGDVGYHKSEIKTPNIDWLATHGIMVDYYFGQPAGSATRSELLTGLKPTHTGIINSFQHRSREGMSTEFVTLPEKLKELGYKTHMVGKWDLGYSHEKFTPTYRGFDTFNGIYNSHADHYTYETCEEDSLVCATDFAENSGKNIGTGSDSSQYSTYFYGNKSVEIIEAHDKNKPLFLMVSYQVNHDPLQAPDECLSGYDSILDENRKLIAGMTTCMDQSIRGIAQALKDADMWKDTFLVFTSDNGAPTGDDSGASNFPLNGGKYDYLDGGIRLVSFAYSERLKVYGQLTFAPMSAADWYATIIHLAGGSTEDMNIDGVNMYDYLTGKEKITRWEVFHCIDLTREHATHEGDKMTEYPHKEIFDVRITAAIRFERWKLLTGNPAKNMEHSWSKIWLYDIKSDPGETRNVWHNYNDVVIGLLWRLRMYLNTTVNPIELTTDTSYDPGKHSHGVWMPWMDKLKEQPLTIYESDETYDVNNGHEDSGSRTNVVDLNVNHVKKEEDKDDDNDGHIVLLYLLIIGCVVALIFMGFRIHKITQERRMRGSYSRIDGSGPEDAFRDPYGERTSLVMSEIETRPKNSL